MIQKIYNPWNQTNKFITADDVNNIFTEVGCSYLRCRDISLYKQCCIHRSYVEKDDFELDENTVMADKPNECMPLQKIDNEELEFEGDSILGAVVALYVRKRFPGKGEGFFTKMKIDLVNNKTLGKLAKQMGMDKFLIISRHVEEACDGRENLRILGSQLEAFIGALYHDYNKYHDSNNIMIEGIPNILRQGGGFQACYAFIIQMYEEFIDFGELVNMNKNYKGVLLDFFQKHFHVTPKYKELSYTGPVHDRTYTMAVLMPDGSILSKYKSKKKKHAEQMCSFHALEYLKKNPQLYDS